MFPLIDILSILHILRFTPWVVVYSLIYLWVSLKHLLDLVLYSFNGFIFVESTL